MDSIILVFIFFSIKHKNDIAGYILEERLKRSRMKRIENIPFENRQILKIFSYFSEQNRRNLVN